VTVFDVDPDTFAAVEVNTAVNECDPTLNAEVVNDALPPATDTGEPRAVDPSLNCTVPATVAGAGVAVIVAFTVTGVPCTTGDAGDTVNEVDVVADAGGGLTT
jgi:hypothetical protein